MRSAWLRVGLASAIACGGCRAAGPASFPGAPVVLVSIDTLRADRLPAYGYGGVATPHLDALRRDALLFQEAWSPCPMTLPTHVSMLTGLLPAEHGVRSNVGYVFDGASHAHLPGLLAARGYATGAAVSSYVLRRESGLGALFDYYEDSTDPRQGEGFADQQRPGGVSLRLAKEWIAAHRERPFFFFLHLYEPHAPYEPPEPFRSRYRDPYDGEIAAADALLGELVAHLQALGLYERAVLVMTSDHGEGLGDHGEQQHSILLYREVLRVPLLIKLPGARRGGESVGAAAQLVDLLPTLAGLAGVVPPVGLRGASLLALADSQVAPRTAAGETLYPRLQLGWSELRSLVDGRWHYIHGPRPELYDMVVDPGERQDLVARHPEIAARLRAALEALPAGETAPAAVDPATAERLAALGYVGEVRPRAAHQALPNPRDSLPLLEPLQRAYRAAGERRLPEAEALLAQLVARSPEMVEAWVKLGEVRLEAGQDVAAADAYAAALAQSPVPLPDVLLAGGLAELRAGRLDAAQAAARRALPALPARARELLARVALARGQAAEAEREARAALDPQRPEPASLVVLAEVLVRRGDQAGALQVLDQAEQRARALGLPAVRRLEALRGDALARAGRMAAAEAAYRREIGAFPGHLQAWAGLAALLAAAGRRAELEPLFEALVAANPNPRAYHVAAVAYEAFGERGAATRWRQRSQAAFSASAR